MTLTAEQRRMRSRKAGLTNAARHDPKEMTKAATAGSWARFEREVDPDGVLPEAERARRARAAMDAHMQGLALKSSIARAQRKGRAA